MKINKQGLSLSNLNDLLENKEEQLSQIFGADFYIKPEGFIDNIATSLSFLEILFENSCSHLVKQFDPETADSEYLDDLYERIGLQRNENTKTRFTIEFIGNPGLQVAAGSLQIRMLSSGFLFSNSESFQFDSDGKAAVLFECLYPGIVSVNPDDDFELETVPDSSISAASSAVLNIITGVEQETDYSLRQRFHNVRNTSEKCSRNAVIKNLSAYVDDISFLKVLDGNSDSSIQPGKILIIAKPNTDDQTFLNAINETVPGGVGFLGNTSITLTLSNGQDWFAAYQKADDVQIYLSVVLKVRSGYYSNTVFANVRKNILAYLNERIFGLNSTVYATEFIIPILEVDGVEAVTDIKVKRSSETSYSSSVSTLRNEIPVFSESNINISAQS